MFTLMSEGAHANYRAGIAISISRAAGDVETCMLGRESEAACAPLLSKQSSSGPRLAASRTFYGPLFVSGIGSVMHT